MPEVLFNEERHVYSRPDGKAYPSTTEVLGEWALVEVTDVLYYVNTIFPRMRPIPAWRFIGARDFGKAVHKATALMLAGRLNWDRLHESLVPVLKQIGKWMVEFDFSPLHIEKPLASEKLWFAGTPDMIGTVRSRGGKVRAIIDLKTGAYGLVGPQTAAYEILDRETHSFAWPIRRYALNPPKDGKDYRFVPLDKKADKRFFLCRLQQFALRGEVHGV